MSERDRGWPEGYGWSEYLDGQIELVKANRAEEIICDEILPLKDREERCRAFLAWKALGIQHTGRTGGTVLELEADLIAMGGQHGESV